MITSVNINNSSDYTGLFNEATKKLRIYAKKLLTDKTSEDRLITFINRFPLEKQYDKDSIDTLSEEEIDSIVKISTLNEYFCNIEELVGKENVFKEEGYKPDYKYLILPLDEEVFEINANSRIITIPPNFKKNGLGVQGDNCAETINFMIDRYFDTTDLAAENVYIAIQYEDPQKNTKIVPAAYIDTTIIQNKVVFGWVIDEPVAAYSGNIKFAVHFFKGDLNDDNHLIKADYAFSTLPAQIAINKGFNFDLSIFDVTAEPSQSIINRLTNSKADGEVQALAPILVIEIPSDKIVDLMDKDGIGFDDNKVLGTEIAYKNSEEDEEDIDEDVYKVSVLAHSPDGGYITYAWYKETGAAKDKEIPSEMVYYRTPDKTRNPKKNYYYKDGDEWIRFRGEEFVADGTTVYYEYRSICKLDEVGTYYAKAINNVGSSSESIQTKTITIPGPTQPVDENIFIDAYKEYKDENNENIKYWYGWDDEVGYARLTIKEISDALLNIKVIPNDTDKETIKYLWYKVKNEVENLNTIPIINFDEIDEKLDLVAEIAGDDVNGGEFRGIEDAGTGWYTVIVECTRNKKAEKYLTGKYYRYTSLPSDPEFDTDVDKTGNPLNNDGRAEIYLSLKQSAKIVLKDLDHTDDLTYKWYVDNDPEGKHGEGDFDTNDKFIEIFGDKKAELTNDELVKCYNDNNYGNLIYCRVTNTYNKVETTRSSYRFVLVSQNDKNLEEE